MNPERSLLVTGCGRSGTKYTASLLGRVGINCGHEQVFTGRQTDLPPEMFAEASWLAAPFLDKLPSGTLVLHQTRDPLAVVSSYVSEGFFRDRPLEKPLWKHVAKRVTRRPSSGQYRLIELVRTAIPQAFSEPTPARRAARFWIDWNELIVRSAEALDVEYAAYRVEDICEDWVRSVVGRLGVGCERSSIEDALRVSKTTNTRPRTSAVTTEDLGPLATEFSEAASLAGYRVA